MSHPSFASTRWRLLAVTTGVAALSVLAVGCSDSKSESTTTATATTEVATTAPETIPGTASATTSTAPSSTTIDSALTAKLPTAADLGPDWKPGAEINEMDLTMNPEVCPGVMLDAELAKRLSGRAGVQFDPVDRGSRHLMVQLVAGEPTQLASDLEAFVAAVKTCPVDAAGAPNTYLSVADVVLPSIGEQRLGVAIKAQESDSGPVWFVRQVAVRVGDLAMTVGLTEILASPTDAATVSDADFVALVTAVAAKLTA